MRHTLPLMLTLAVACGGGPPAPGTTHPVGSPEAVVTQFLRAVADSNITGITELWGTERGPASVTRQPDEYRRRAVIIQSYLRHDSARIVSQVPGAADPASRDLIVEIARRGCVKRVPFTTVPYQGGWLVSSVDLNAAGNPARGCRESGG